MRRFEVGDRVSHNGRIMDVTELEPAGYEPAGGSAYVVRCGPPGATKPDEEWVFGDRTLKLLRPVQTKTPAG